MVYFQTAKVVPECCLSVMDMEGEAQHGTGKCVQWNGEACVTSRVSKRLVLGPSS